MQVEWKYAERRFKLVDTAGITRTKVTKNNPYEADRKNTRASEKVGYEKFILPGTRALRPTERIMRPDDDPSQFSYQVHREYRKKNRHLSALFLNVKHCYLSKIQISEMALQSALNALRFSQVVVLVVEGDQGQFSKVDLQLARKCLQEGRSLVVAANKSDLMINSGISPG